MLSPFPGDARTSSLDTEFNSKETCSVENQGCFVGLDGCYCLVRLTSSAFCSSAVGIDKSSVSSAFTTPGREAMTEAMEVAATSRIKSALEDDVFADNCVFGFNDADDRTKASDEAKNEERRKIQQDFMVILCVLQALMI
jgi:hypothetical protein